MSNATEAENSKNPNTNLVALQLAASAASGRMFADDMNVLCRGVERVEAVVKSAEVMVQSQPATTSLLKSRSTSLIKVRPCSPLLPLEMQL